MSEMVDFDWLSRFTIRNDGDATWLTCDECDSVLSEVVEGDLMAVLLRLCDNHIC